MSNEGSRIDTSTPNSRALVSIITTEKAYILAEKHNYLTIKTYRNMSKRLIKEFIEKSYNVKVVKVNTLIDRDGYKKAYVKLAPENRALDIIERASR
ncbi:MAG: 50S ribosomal protein L23 [Ignisphaera sp.]|nr:50S ribosomal protein L23 [Ignisphaera sp.]MCX8168468.1 50S ribosomal protein L23 [Ignisphaera sp.]MDW8085092.1 50S ribosomal protein L23 [Ignisphaera sp.]